MIKINIQLFGGRGAKSGANTFNKPSALAAFKENARQFNEALQNGKKNKAAIVEFTDITGKTTKHYWDGAAYRSRPNSMYNSLNNKDMTGMFKSDFKAPKEWG